MATRSDHSPRRRRLVVAAGAATVAGGSFAVCGTALAQYAAREGKEFRRVADPQDKALKEFLATLRQKAAGNPRVEVLEFFQYSCPHCYTFNKDLEEWRKSAGADVDYRRVPVHWDNSTLNHTKLYYALRKLGKQDALHEQVFAAFHVNKRRLLAPNEIADFVASAGIDRKAFLDAFNSDEIASETEAAAKTWRAFGIDGTPALVIDERYVTSPSLVGTREGGIRALNAVVLRARSERPAKK
jgi:protein dithiol oxidoreductase (disulfide-forming)